MGLGSPVKPIPARRCQVDDAYAFTYSEDPALGVLTPTLCSHQPAFIARLQGRAPPTAAPASPVRTFTVCATHRAILEAFDRSIRASGGRPRILEVRPLA